MSDIIRVNDSFDGQAVLSASGGALFHPQSDHVIARIVDGEIVGGVVYQRYRDASVEMHIAGFRPNWINRTGLFFVFDYPFRELRVKKVLALVPASNAKALRLNAHVGFTEEARIPDVYPDGDLVIMSMYRKDCRWIPAGGPKS